MKSVELVSLARRRRFYVVAREAVSTPDSITWPKFLTCPHINFSAIIQWILSRELFVLSTARNERNERNDKTDRSIRNIIPMSETRYYHDFFDSSYPLFGKIFVAFFLSRLVKFCDETWRDVAWLCENSSSNFVHVCLCTYKYVWRYTSPFYANIMFHILSSFQFYRYTRSHTNLLQKWKRECVT